MPKAINNSRIKTSGTPYSKAKHMERQSAVQAPLSDVNFSDFETASDRETVTPKRTDTLLVKAKARKDGILMGQSAREMKIASLSRGESYRSALLGREADLSGISETSSGHESSRDSSVAEDDEESAREQVCEEESPTKMSKVSIIRPPECLDARQRLAFDQEIGSCYSTVSEALDDARVLLRDYTRVEKSDRKSYTLTMRFGGRRDRLAKGEAWSKSSQKMRDYKLFVDLLCKMDGSGNTEMDGAKDELGMKGADEA